MKHYVAESKVFLLSCQLCLVALVACASLEAQTSIKLSATRTLPTPEFAHGMILPVKCDADGNIFFRGMGGRVPIEGALQRMSADGKSVLTIHTKTGDFTKTNPSDFNTAPDGTLYAVLSTRHNYLVEFDEHGETKRQTEISAYERASEIDNFAAFSSDRFLIAGRLFEKGQPAQQFTAIIDADGKLVREVKLQNEVDPEEKNAGEVVLGPAVAGDDGNAYVLRIYPEGARVHVISANGEVLRTLVVPTPVPKGIAGQFGVAKGHLAIEFHRDDLPTWFKVVDTQTGDEIASYESDVGGMFVCYSPDGFDFFVNDPTTKKFDLVRAVPQ
jgi:hypothetical protein